MKTWYVLGLALVFSFAAVSADASGSNDGSTFVKENVAIVKSKKDFKEQGAAMTKEEKDVRIAAMKERVNEIKAMDKSQLTKEERKALRQELRSMNKEARAYGYGVVFVPFFFLLCGTMLIIVVSA